MFIIRSLLGFRRRNQGFSGFLLIGGIVAICMGCSIAGFGIPFSLYRAWQVANFPQPSAAELVSLTPGTSVLSIAQISPDHETGEHGLALYYVEVEASDTSANERDGNGSGSSSTTWQMVTPPPNEIDLMLLDGETLTVQLPAKPSFLNAQQITEPNPSSTERTNDNDSPTERRITGYLPGQTLTVEGTWEGNQRLTAQTLFAGTPDAYIDYLTYTQPGAMLFGGFFCGGLGLLFLIFGAVMRFLGR